MNLLKFVNEVLPAHLASFLLTLFFLFNLIPNQRIVDGLSYFHYYYDMGEGSNLLNVWISSSRIFSQNLVRQLLQISPGLYWYISSLTQIPLSLLFVDEA